jgi:hypothetical protein
MEVFMRFILKIFYGFIHLIGILVTFIRWNPLFQKVTIGLESFKIPMFFLCLE